MLTVKIGISTVKKKPIRERMKPVVEALRQGNKKHSELLSLGVPEKTLDIILKDYLEYLGLAEKKGVYWAWYTHTRVFENEEERKAALKHSEKLVPALDNVLLCSFTPEDLLFKAFDEHLKTGYPEIHQKLTEFLEMKDEKDNKESLLKYAKKLNNLSLGYPDYECIRSKSLNSA